MVIEVLELLHQPQAAFSLFMCVLKRLIAACGTNIPQPPRNTESHIDKNKKKSLPLG